MARPLTITANGNAQLDTAEKKSGSASLLLDGIDDYVTVSQPNAEISASGDWTVELWVYLDNVNNSNGLIRLPGSRFYIFITVSAGNSSMDCQVIDNGTDYDILYNFPSRGTPLFGWKHVAVTRSGNNLRLWFDGSLVGSNTTAGDKRLNWDNNTGDVTIGDVSGDETDGWIDEVRISNVLRYTGTGSFTPQSRFVPDENTLLLVHFDGTDASTTFTDDIGIQGSASLNSTFTQTATQNPNPSMVFIVGNDYIWQDTDTWNVIYLYDVWSDYLKQKYQFPDTNFGFTAQALSIERGQAQLSATFTTTTRGGLQRIADSQLSSTTEQSVSASITRNAQSSLSASFTETSESELFRNARSELSEQFLLTADSNVKLPVTGNAELSSQSQIEAFGRVDITGISLLSDQFNIAVTAKNLKLADLEISDFAEITVTAEVEITAKANISSTAALTARAGLIVEPNTEYDYTWETAPEDSWSSFYQDRWQPRGLFIFEDITLSALGGLESTAQANLTSEFTVSAISEKIIPGSCDLDTESELLADANIIRNVQAGLQAVFDLDVTALNLDIAASLLAFDADVSAKGGIIIPNQAEFTVNTDLTISGDRLVNAGSLLSDQFDLFSNAFKYVESTADLSANVDLSAKGSRIRQSSSEMTAFAAQLVVGDRFPGGSSDLSSEFTVSAFGGSVFNAKANLEGFVAQISDGRISDVRGSANLFVTVDTQFEGDLRLLESEFVYYIISENRNILIPMESRIFDILVDSRQIDIKSETRILPVLEETRTISVAKSLMT